MLLRHALRRREALLAAGLSLLAPAARAADAIRLVGAAGAEQGTAAMQRFVQELEGTVRGRVQIALDTTPIGDGAALLAQLQGGQATLGWVRAAEVGAVAPEIATLTAPFLFADRQKVFALVDSVQLGPLLNNEFRKHGLEPLGFLNGGALRLAGPALPKLLQPQPQPVAARPGALRQEMFAAIGLQLAPWPPQPLAAAHAGLVELRSDDLTAQAGPGPLTIVDPPHAHDLIVVLANREGFAALPLDIRETARTRMQETVAWQRGGAVEADAAALATLRRQGASLAPLPEDQRRQAHEKVKATLATALRDTAEPSVLATVLAYAE